MITCPRCGNQNPLSTADCSACGQPLRALPVGRPDPSREAEHIAYLLAQIPGWRERGLVPDASADVLTREYAGRRDALLQPRPAPAGLAPPIYSALAGARQPGPPAPPQPAGPTAPTRTAAGQPWLAEFLETHWLKLLAALAAVFIFAGMRQVLGWEWVSAYALAALPLLPAGLAAAFYFFGMRARREDQHGRERALGGFVYLAVAIVLAAFTVIAANRYWLRDALPQDVAALAGAAASTTLAGWTLYRARDLAFLHLLLGGVAATLFAGLHVAFPSPVFAPAPVAVYSGAFLLLAAALIVLDRLLLLPRADERPSGAALVWAHLSVTFALAIALRPLAAGAAPSGEAGALLAGAALLYAASAQWFGSPRLSWTSGALGALSSALFIEARPGSSWYAWGFAAVVLSAGALGLSLANRALAARQEAPGELGAIAEAYTQLGIVFSAAAGLAVAGRTAAALAGLAASVAGPDWRQGALLAACCAGLYAAVAVAARRPAALYAAAVGAAFALTLAANRLAPYSPLLSPHTLAHDLLPFTAAALGLAIALRRAAPAEWSAPLFRSALAASSLGIAVAIVHGADMGPTGGLWTALLGYAALAAVGAVADQRGRSTAAGWAAALLADLTACSAFLAGALAPGRADSMLFSGFGLTLAGAVWTGAALLLGRRAGEQPWLRPAKTVALAAPMLGALFTMAAPDPALFGMAAGLALAFAVLALLALLAATVRPGAAPGAAAFAVLVLGTLRLWVVAEGACPLHAAAGLLVALFGLGAGAAYGAAAWRRRFDPAVWLATAALGICGAAGAAFGGTSSPLALATAIVATVGLVAGSVGLGAAAIRGRRPAFGYAAGLAACAVWYLLAVRVGARPVETRTLAALPLVAGLYAAGVLQRRANDMPLGLPLRRTATGLAVVACAYAVVTGLLAPAAAGWTITGTLLAYSAALLASALYERTREKVALFGAALTTALGYHLHAISLTPASWALGIACAGAAWALAGRALEAWQARRAGSDMEQLAPAPYGLAAVAALLGAVVALAHVAAPGEGTAALLALVVAGAALFGLWLFGTGEAAAHAGAVCYLLAYGLYLYDRVKLGPDVLPFYTLPVGLYLVILGHVAGARGQEERASALWWLGLLATITPAFAAFYRNSSTGAGSLDAALLLAECLGAIAWGIARRIRAFVFAGTLFALAFAVVLGRGAAVEVWSGLIALALGVALLALVFTLTVHQDAVRRWMERMGVGWREWR